MSVETVTIGPMTTDLLLWRCLHCGALTADSIGTWPAAETATWLAHRDLNVPLLRRICETYGTCAILARDDDEVVGFLRFYPKTFLALEGTGRMCLQQSYPAGPSLRLLGQAFPLLEEMDDKTLVIHCMMTSSPFIRDNPYRRRGLGTRMAQELIAWARARGWEGIEATAYEDVEVLYTHTGQAGRRFWERLGFSVAGVDAQPRFSGHFLETIEAQLVRQGLDASKAQHRYTMRLDLERE